MSIDFPQGRFEAGLHQRLQTLLHDYSQADHYAVFDFDNTSVFNDIEDTLMMAMLDQFTYLLSPDDFYQTISSGPFDYQETFFNRSELSLAHLVQDLASLYRELYHQNDPKSQPAYPSFAAKLRLFYNLINTHFDKVAGQTWPSYLFKGFSPAEFCQIGQDALQANMDAPFDQVLLHSSDQRPGLTGPVQATFESGLAFPEDLRQLFACLTKQGIRPYIVSASPRLLVQVAVELGDYAIAPEDIFGMEIACDDQGRLTDQVLAKSYVTKGQGKVDCIQKLIQPRHGGKDPLMVFGDSMGDYALLTAFKGTQARGLFNRYQNNATQDLVHAAQEPDSSYFVQGRDENTGQLRPSQLTLPLGSQQAILYASDFKGQASLAE
ncbi:haloacid dehalogenase-like hydrolase [Aerococcus sanguinicola]|uniref:phosphoserine phosphatase n=1 Tax=Aerococcus sanguinicola TaxID=119206 RepID=A0A5N1GIE9_9LACT|nr:HAD family hydrolase [Aerococcus sanguinicola]KAA9300184.1 haloacid dehalogenase-like hydrolase [Aerococcus sanguinicola]